MRPFRAYALLGALAAFLASPGRAQTLTDALFNAHHPRLMITPAELPALHAKLSDGGVDDATYSYVRHMVLDVYPTMAFDNILAEWYGDQSLPCIGLVGQLEGNTGALALGKALTTYIADHYEPDYDEASSGMRLRSLALGYDLCFQNATPAERAHIRDEMVLYMQRMEWTPGYQIFEHQPYLGNHSAMFGAALGLAAIALQGETQSNIVNDGMAMTDRIVDNLLRFQFDPNGAYNEGVLYAAWTLRQLVYYFDARHRFDGRAYTDNPQLRAIEEWMAYELLPEGGGRSQNLNDSSLLGFPLARHPTFFNWAMSAWNSGLSAWLWEHTVSGFGANIGTDTDWPGTILWHRDLTLTQPGSVLPQHRIWTQRGLYYFRTGWPAGSTSNDVVFSFYSGKFQGGHAQEDQNQFSFAAYGTSFAIDHGAGDIAKESESHNMVFIDGKGQHNAGSSIGTDGAITGNLLGDFADVVFGDATSAYGTYSEFNAPNVPLPGTDWSWGYAGANPVRFARRAVLFVHGVSAPPYAMVMDDIDKDGFAHNYEWRMHTSNTNVVSAGANPVAITGPTASMDLHLVDPDFSGVSVTTSFYDAGNADPASILIRVGRTAVNPKFTFVMLPRPGSSPAPALSRQSFAWGCGATVDRGGGNVDVLLRNDSGAPVTYAGVTTDAAAAVVRKSGSAVESYLMAKGRTLSVSGTNYATINNGPGICECSGSTIRLDRYDADFKILNTGVSRVRYREQELGFVVNNGYVVPDGVTSVPAPLSGAALSVTAQPNPFNPATVIHIADTRNERVTVSIYDVAGRRVRSLWNGWTDSSRVLMWDGRSDGGASVSSGTYFVRVRTTSQTRALKLVLLK